MKSTATVLAFSLTGLLALAADLDPDLMQTAHRFEAAVTTKVSLPYLRYLPTDYETDSSRRWPLILFLHGAGERGDDLNKVAVHGPPKLVSKQFRARANETEEQKAARLEAVDLLKQNFIIVSPQCPKDTHWRAHELSALLDEIEGTLRVDAKRIYLTGLSMGGFGTWDLGLTQPDRFAALAPVCGGMNTITPLLNRRHPTKGKIQKNLPIWVFHGEEDSTVLPEESRRAVALLRRLGNKKARLTTYPETGHDSWTATYENPELYRWFLAHEQR